MPQHFLLSAAARTLSLKAIYKAGEGAAYETFKGIRWASILAVRLYARAVAVMTPMRLPRAASSNVPPAFINSQSLAARYSPAAKWPSLTC